MRMTSTEVTRWGKYRWIEKTLSDNDKYVSKLQNILIIIIIIIIKLSNNNISIIFCELLLNT